MLDVRREKSGRMVQKVESYILHSPAPRESVDEVQKVEPYVFFFLPAAVAAAATVAAVAPAAGGAAATVPVQALLKKAAAVTVLKHAVGLRVVLLALEATVLGVQAPVLSL